MGLLSSKTYTNWCESRISLNLTKLHQDLSSRVYGQHIAVNIVYHAISDFASESTENRHTPLVLSFHGWTRSGKNHISTLLAESIPSQSVHRYLIPRHFPHREQSDKYEENIPVWIQGNLTKCAINLIIFDEMDKANSGVCNNCLCNNHGLCNINRLRNKKTTAYVITTACVIRN